MARIINANNLCEERRKKPFRSFQSAHIDFLLGSGAFQAAIPTARPIKAEIAALLSAGTDGEAYEKIYATVEIARLVEEGEQKAEIERRR